MAKAKKDTTAEVKTEVKAAPKTEVKAEAAEAKTETKAAKTTAKKTAAKAKEAVIKVTIEYQGKNTTIRSIVDNIYEIEGGKDAVQTLDVYVQPENGVAYYVANGKEEGKSVNL